MDYKAFCFLSVLTIIDTVYAVSFMRSIEAVGYPYYKILFSLGTCKERILFEDEKVWGAVRLNRIFDIYYKAYDRAETISRVEINLVINNTDCISYSSSGVGKAEFSAFLVLPMNVGIVLYSLTIFSCTRLENGDLGTEIIDG